MNEKNRREYVKSQYKHVRGIECNKIIYWAITFSGFSRDHFKTEREAAIAADKILINKGKDPVNILKPIIK